MTKHLNTDLIFKDRIDAGKQLAEKIFLYKLENPVVIALPRGGVTVAKPIADKLNVKLDIMVSKKIGAPNNPELAIGGVTSHGDYVIAPYIDDVIDEPFVGDKKWDFLQKQIVYLINDCREREMKYRTDQFQTDPYQDRNIILVDDGTATGMTVLAAIKSIKKQNPKFIVLAIPVISSQAYDEIQKQINKIEALKIPDEFIAVGSHFEDFNPVSDEEIKDILNS